jgi:hypothetical protein
MVRTRKYDLKKQLFDLEVKGQGPTKVITVHDTLPYGHAPTYQISLTCQKTKMLWSGFKKQLFDLEVKGQGPTKVITVHGTPPYGHAPTYQISWKDKKVMVQTSFAEKKRKKKKKKSDQNNMSPFVQRGDIIIC